MALSSQSGATVTSASSKPTQHGTVYADCSRVKTVMVTDREEWFCRRFRSLHMDMDIDSTWVANSQAWRPFQAASPNVPQISIYPEGVGSAHTCRRSVRAAVDPLKRACRVVSCTRPLVYPGTAPLAQISSTRIDLQAGQTMNQWWAPSGGRPLYIPPWCNSSLAEWGHGVSGQMRAFAPVLARHCPSGRDEMMVCPSVNIFELHSSYVGAMQCTRAAP